MSFSQFSLYCTIKTGYVVSLLVYTLTAIDMLLSKHVLHADAARFRLVWRRNLCFARRAAIFVY
jgi:hypothetical protein